MYGVVSTSILDQAEKNYEVINSKHRVETNCMNLKVLKLSCEKLFWTIILFSIT